MRNQTLTLLLALMGFILAGCSNAVSAENGTLPSATPPPVATATHTPEPEATLGDLLLGKWSAKLQPSTLEIYLVASYYEFLDGGIVIATSVYSDGRESTSSAEYQVLDETRIRLVTPLASEVWEIAIFDPDAMAITYPNNVTVEHERVSP